MLWAHQALAAVDWGALIEFTSHVQEKFIAALGNKVKIPSVATLTFEPIAYDIKKKTRINYYCYHYK